MKNDKSFDIVRHISPYFDNVLDIEYPLNRIAEPDLATLKNIRDYLKVSYEDLLDD